MGLEAMLAKHGRSLADVDYMNFPEWSNIVCAAKRAYSLVLKNNKLHDLKIDYEEEYPE